MRRRVERVRARSRTRGFAVIVVLVLLGVCAVGLMSFVWTSSSQHRIALHVVRRDAAREVERTAFSRMSACVNGAPWGRRFWLGGGSAASALEPSAGGVRPVKLQYSSAREPMREDWPSFEGKAGSYAGSIGDLSAALQRYEVFTAAQHQGEKFTLTREIEYSQGLMGPLNRDGTVMQLGFAGGSPPEEGDALGRLRAAREQVEKARLEAAGAEGARIEAALRHVNGLPLALAVAAAAGRRTLPLPPPGSGAEQPVDAEETLKGPFEAVARALEAEADEAADGATGTVDCKALREALAAAVSEYNRAKNVGITKLEELFQVVAEPVDANHPSGTFTLVMDEPRPAENPGEKDIYKAHVRCTEHGGAETAEQRNFLRECVLRRLRLSDEGALFPVLGGWLSAVDGEVKAWSTGPQHFLPPYDDPGGGKGQPSNYRLFPAIACTLHGVATAESATELGVSADPDYEWSEYLREAVKHLDARTIDPEQTKFGSSALALELESRWRRLPNDQPRLKTFQLGAVIAIMRVQRNKWVHGTDGTSTGSGTFTPFARQEIARIFKQMGREYRSEDFE